MAIHQHELIAEVSKLLIKNAFETLDGSEAEAPESGIINSPRINSDVRITRNMINILFGEEGEDYSNIITMNATTGVAVTVSCTLDADEWLSRILSLYMTHIDEKDPESEFDIIVFPNYADSENEESTK